MDYCNLDSEVADTLNFLRPPVLRGFRKTCKETHSSSSAGCSESPKLLRDHRSKVSKHIRIPVVTAPSSISTEDSSSSVIYRKTSEEKVLKKFSVLSYTNFQHSRKTVQHAQPNSAKEKPLIQVTVIPKQSDHRSLKLRKRGDPKPPHITVSNQENSTKSSETFFLVSGRKQERVYEIKTTSSAEVTSNSYIKNERVSIDEVKHFKQLLDYLNMDKKKKKWKKQKEDGKSKKGGKNADEDREDRESKGSFAGRNFAVGGNECPTYCSYPCASKKGSRDTNDLNNRKSRVRITGRIGLTEDDQYVLRCAATVDDKPVLTNVAQIPLPPEMFNKDFKLNKKDLRPYEEEDTDHSRERGIMKDSNVQADFHIETSYDRARTSKSPGFSKDAQFESHDNYNTVTLSNIETLKIVSNKNAKIQMNGPGEISNMGFHNEGNNKYDGSQYPNCCSNPLVIISVYPKQETADKKKADKSAGRDSGYKSPPTMNVLTASQKTRASLGSKPKSEKDTRSPSPRSTRSPSPARSSSPSSPSPISSPTRKQPKVKNSIVQTDSKTGKAKKKESAAQTPTKSKMPQKKESIKDNGKNSPRKFGSPAKAAGKKTVNANSASQAKNQQTTTDVEMTKKALVDTYTKKITEQMDKNAPRRYPAKNDVSNVTINIEGEHEFYDLMFHQGNQTTDLRVRRSVKDQGSQIHEYESPSLENFLLSENYPDPANRKRSFSHTFYEQSNDDLVLQIPTQSRLNVRDSIEICHRREKSCADALQSTGYLDADVTKPSRNLSRDSFGNFYGSSEQPEKHFQGDNCSILNPIERDKEIRRLLGVKRSRTKQTAAQAEVKSGIRFNIQPNYKNWCNSDQSLLREIGDSLDSYNNLSTSKSFEEKMNRIYNTSAICADCACRAPKQCTTKYETRQPGTSEQQIENDKRQPGTTEQQLENDKRQPGTSEQTIENYKRQPVTSEQQIENDKIKVDLEFRRQRQFAQTPQSENTDETHIQMVLNRSINVFIEMKKFSNQKPIVLSRKQYEKVKKAIWNGGLSLKKNSTPSPRAWFNQHWRSGESTGAASSTNQQWRSGDSAAPETHSKRSDETPRTTVHKPTHQNPREPTNPLDETNYNCKKDTQVDDRCLNDNIQYCNQNVALPNYPEEPEHVLRTCYYCGRPQSETNNYCYFCGMYLSVDEDERLFYQTPEVLPTSSSKIVCPYTMTRPTEIHYSFAYVEFSSTNAEAQTPMPPPPSISTLSDSKNVERSDSILTIFKGRRKKSATPNLIGTSIYSISTSEYSDDLSASLGGEKAQKPLLRRLMSCLVMRSARATPLKLPARPIQRTKQGSSVDSYHISTSLGAIELGSSLYDTSASFYSSHSIHPVTSKTRRGGFLRSIRSYLASRKTSPFKKDA